jgi:hypothetical protein
MRHSTALPLAWTALRILIVLNWVFGACILALLAYTFVDEPWTMKALGVSGYPDAATFMNGMRAVAALGLVAIPFNHAMFTRMLRIVETVRVGNPFVAENAYRLNAIAWILLALQLLSMIIGWLGKALSTAEHPFHLDAGFSASGWLAVLLAFVLARVFAEGTIMREDLEGTI